MKHTIAFLALLFLGGSALAGPEPGRPTRGAPPNNLAVDVDAPGAVRAEIGIAIPSLKEELRYSLSVDDGAITGGVYVPPGPERFISVTAFDANGEKIYSGGGYANIDEKLTREIAIELDGGKDAGRALTAKFGTYRLALGVEGGEKEGVLLHAALIDASGKPVSFEFGDLKWELPEGFPTLPYSCFLNELCIWFPDFKREGVILACYQDLTCWHKPPKNTDGPYRFVTVGRNHTCALTTSDELRCWGNNTSGQLGVPTPALCASGNGACSLVPLPVQCPSGAVCKFRAVAAGNDHTCAIDTAGKAWCWGDDWNLATGEFSPNGAVWFQHREVKAFHPVTGAPVQFTGVDTNLDHTCAVSTANDVYCWGLNDFRQLGFVTTAVAPDPNGTRRAMQVPGGVLYQSVAVGARHTCATRTTGGIVDCWGDNGAFQLSGNAGALSGVTVNTVIPLLQGRPISQAAIGRTATCAQLGDDTVCWGSPGRNLPFPGNTNLPSSSTAFVALRDSFARSISTDSDTCSWAAPDQCTRICIAAGDLQCGTWSAFGTSLGMSAIKEGNDGHAFIVEQTNVGPNHVCSLTLRRDVWCFGRNDYGQFGNGTFSASRNGEHTTAARR